MGCVGRFCQQSERGNAGTKKLYDGQEADNDEGEDDAAGYGEHVLWSSVISS